MNCFVLPGSKTTAACFAKKNIVYQADQLSTIFNRPPETVRKALRTLSDYGMITVEDGAIVIKNWSKYQQLDTYEKQKEYHREYMAQRRKKERENAQSELVVSDRDFNCDFNCDLHVNGVEVEEEKEEDYTTTLTARARAREENDKNGEGNQLSEDEIKEILGEKFFPLYKKRYDTWTANKNADVPFGIVVEWYKQDVEKYGEKKLLDMLSGKSKKQSAGKKQDLTSFEVDDFFSRAIAASEQRNT